MIRQLRALSLLALAAPVFALGAQAKPGAPAAAAPTVDPCPIELMQPTGLGIANLQRAKLAQVKSAADANAVMRDVSKLLFDDKQKANPLGRDMLLAEFITFDIQFADSAKRGDIGFPGDKNQYVDFLKWADSLFTIVEKAEPKCVNTTLAWRNYKTYGDRIRAAYAAVGAGAADTAEKLANRAMILNHTSPQPYDVLWRAAKIRDDSAKAHNDATGMAAAEAKEIANLSLAADKLEGDTLNGAVRSNFLFTLGRIQQEIADGRTDKAEKDKLYRDAAKAYLQVLREFPTGEESAYSMQGVMISANILSDTSISNQALALVKAAPDKYPDATLEQAGVLETTAGKFADAAAFFGAAVKANPYSRDYLYNYAAMLAETKQSGEMIAVTHKLIDLDPSNPDDLQLFMLGFKSASDNTKDPAVKRASIDSVQYYGKLAEDMPVHLTYTIDRQLAHTVLIGSLENRSKVAREAATMEFEFIGKDGALLQKGTGNIPAIAAGATGVFKVDVPVVGVLGVRYAALPLK